MYTSSVFAGIIISVIPIVGIVCDVLIMRAKVTKTQIICAVSSVIGVIITTLDTGDMNSSTKGILFLSVAELWKQLIGTVIILISVYMAR